jgi:molecular chaperone DnaJ
MASRGHDSEAGGPSGDLLIRVKVNPHPRFRREGYDVIGDTPITIPLAVLGGNITVETVHGEVSVPVPPGTNTNDHYKIAKHGINHLPPNTNRKGDHFVNFKVEVPKTISDRQRELYE